MKILINGNSVSEIIRIKNSNSITIEDIKNFDRFIGHLKKNKNMYIKLVALLAMTIDSATLTVFAADSLEGGLGKMVTTIVGKLIILAKYACMGMGLKEMIICLLNGGNMREASFSGIQFWLGYLFLQFYPSLYEFNI